MLRLRRLATFTVATLGLVGLAVIGLSRAAPERTVPQSFGERVASGAASLMMQGIAAGYTAQTGQDLPEDGAPVLVHVTFTAEGDLDEFEARMDGFAPFLSNVPGLEWKVWTLDRATRDASGTYLFASRTHAEMYLSEILPEGMGNVPYISGMHATIGPVLEGPSGVTRGLAPDA